ncbi:MAG: protein kinase domain-containing protein [Chloroflexota bacterium]
MTDALIGRTLRGGEYELREVIAHGGQATVYRAYARHLDADVVVKVLNENLAADSDFRERFHDEARTLEKLHHKNLVEVKCYGEEAELVYIVMRLVPGGTLRDRLQALGGSLGLTDAARTIGQIAEALQHAHDKGVVHLDVKPANVLLGRADWPLVTDLGLARAIQREVTGAGLSRVAGTPAYMSQEQCRGAAIDERSDQYSLAVTAYELLTGQQPFQAETTEALLQKHIETAPPRPRQINPGLPGPIEEVLLRGLAKEPDDRFPRIADFGQALTEAVERTRGVSLEAKLAAAATAPNLLAILALVLAAPFMLAILPVGNVLGRLPLAWPFQLLLSGSIAALLLGIRWHLIGLVGRGVSGSLAILDRLSRKQVMLGTGVDGPLHVKAWRRTAVASVEGMVNLLYVLATYRLVAAPGLAVARTLLDPTVFPLVETIVLVLVGGVVVGIIGGIFRGAGPIPAALVLALAWAAAITLPTFDVDLSGAKTLALTAQLVVAAGLLLLLGAQRRSAGETVGRLASGTVGRLLVEGRPGISPEHSAASARQIERLACGVLDFGYLLLGYALLRTPVVDLLSPLTTPLAAAIVATGAACAIWLVLIVRLHWTAGIVGGVLGIVLGAPVLVSLPVLDTALLQATWPATLASWGAAGALLALLAVLRGPTQMIGRTALGARLDRGLLGASAASTEEQSARRASALGGVAGALLDICFLLIAYWVIGVPISNALIRMTHEPALGSVVLMFVLLAALGLILAPSRRAASTLVETGGTQWRGRTRAFTVAALAAAAMLIALGGAAPAAVAGPSVLSPAAFTPDLARVSPRVIVDRDDWLPWSPLPEQATYNLALSCSDGRSIGQFHEVYEPLLGSSMPAGSAGPLGLTNVGCDEWQRLDQTRRHAAGLTDAPSLSWEWLHLQATVNEDLSSDVVETQRVLFSAGEHQSLAWDFGVPDSIRLSSVEVLSDSEVTAAKDVRVNRVGGRQRVTWSIPTLVGPAERTYTIKYHLTPGAGADGPSVFEHTVASPERGEPIWQATVEVRLPASLSQQSLDLVSGGLAARTGLTRDHSAWFEASDLPGSQAFTVTVKALSAPPVSPTPTAQPPDWAPAALAPAPPPAATSAPGVPPTALAARGAAQSTAMAAPGATASTPTAPPLPSVEASPSPQGTVAPEATATEAATLTATASPWASGGGESGPEPTSDVAVESTPTPTLIATLAVTPIATPTLTAMTLTPAATASATDGSITPSTTPTSTPIASATPAAAPTRTVSRGSGGSADTTSPIIRRTISPAPNAQGWNNTPLTITWSTTDPESGISVSSGCTPTTVSAETSGFSQVCHAINGAGIEASDSVRVQLDMTAPAISHVLSPAPNALGWNNSPVTISWIVSNPLSGIDTATGCTATTLSTETTGTTLTCRASSVAGNIASESVLVKIDTTPPLLETTLTPVLGPAGQNIQIGVVASKELAELPAVSVSGSCVNSASVSMTRAGSTLPPAYVGTYTVPAGTTDCSVAVSAAATDIAGNPSLGGSAALAVDRTPPTLGVNASPRRARAGDKASIEVLASETLAVPPVVTVTGTCLSRSPIVLSVTPTGQSDRYLAVFDVPVGSSDCTADIVAGGSDRAGNQGSGNTRLAIDRTPPQLDTSVSPALGRASASIRITVAASEALNGAPSVSISGTCVPDAAVSMAPNSSAFVGTYTIPAGLTNCTAAAQATAADLAGNPSLPISGWADFSIKRSQPVLITTASPSLAHAGTAVSIAIDSGPDQLAEAPTVRVTGDCIPSSAVSVSATNAATTYSGIYTVPAGTTDCTASISASGFDSAGNASSGGQRTFGIDRTPPQLRVGVAPNPVSPAGIGNVTVDASEDLGSAPTVTLAAAQGCLPRDIPVSLSPTGQARSYSGTFSVPDINGNCTASVVVNAEDLANNTGSSTTSLAIAQAMQKLSVSISSPVSGNGAVVSDPAGIQCFAGPNDSCSMSVPRNQAVTLFARNNNELVAFDNWKGSDACSGADPTCKVVMDRDHAEVANFVRRDNSALRTPTASATIAASPVAPASPTETPRSTAVATVEVTPTPTATISPTDTPAPTPTVIISSASIASPSPVAPRGLTQDPTAPPVPTAPSAPRPAPSAVPRG